MDFLNTYKEYGYPFSDNKLMELKAFLSSQGLRYDLDIDYTVVIRNKRNNIIATGSLSDNILKCIAVSCEYQGDGLMSSIVSDLLSRSFLKGNSDVYLYTLPKNKNIFYSLGFKLITQTKDVLFMENKKNGVNNFILSIQKFDSDDIGCIIANCNPFTLGHRYLIEEACKLCSHLYVFVLSEDRSIFSAKTRLDLVKMGTHDISNVYIYPSSNYIISNATFPTYFIKDECSASDINCDLDIKIFIEYFAKSLNIKKRFVGNEPYCRVTSSYNKYLKENLVKHDIEVIKINRFCYNDKPISASYVRDLLKENKFDLLKYYLPKSTYDFLLTPKGREICKLIK